MWVISNQMDFFTSSHGRGTDFLHTFSVLGVFTRWDRVFHIPSACLCSWLIIKIDEEIILEDLTRSELLGSSLQMIENLNTVVFDLDGTLLQTETIVVGAIQTALARTSATFRVDVCQPSQDEILSLVGTPVYEFADSLDLSLADDAFAFFSTELEDEEIRQIEDGQARLFEGVPELLADLRSSSFGLALISNCSRRYLMAVCDYFSLWDYFDFSLCAEDIPRAGKARLLQEILEKTETLPAEAIYLGDRVSDLEAARAIRCGFIGCLWGYGKREFDDSVPTVASIQELAAVLSQIRSAQT